MTFPFYRQLNEMDCGPTCLRMISKFYGKYYNANTIREKAGFSKQGVSLLGISDTAEKLGFRTRGVQINYTKLQTVPLPAILHWSQNHFVVLTSINRRGVKIADPAIGVVSYTRADFGRYWVSSKIEDIGEVGTLLMLEPAPRFYDAEGEKENKLQWGKAFQYLRQSKWQLSQIFAALIVSSVMQLMAPFLAQSMVDIGINTRNLQYITIVLIAQLVLAFSGTVLSFIYSRLQLRFSNTTNISILSDFWIKLTRLPLAYFDTRHTGDTMQRLGDNGQIQSFITGQAISTIFSVFNFLVYAIVLILYSIQIFIIFIVGNLLYFGWIRLFMGIRRKLNYETFHLSANENNATLQLIQGMQEIRLNNAERLMRWDWENIQARIFKLRFKSLNYGQIQSVGALFISQGKDLLISFTVAQMVVQGHITLGGMVAIQYIIGQLSAPTAGFINLMQTLQDTKISMERLNEVHNMEDEEPTDKNLLSALPDTKDIVFEHLSFAYPGSANDPVLKNIDLRIPEGKITAIVGVSGSGKTTLLKILLKIYELYQGEIKIGESNLRYMSASFWRSKCGSVLQDGYIFNETIARNIAIGDEYTDKERLIRSCRLANILSFIETLPNGFNTKLGADGVGVSQGQRQRLLIARAIYKDPEYLFFDEATNALDANNEKAIVENLQTFFEGRTVIVVAHRLSTVRNADNIVVLHEGSIMEEGTHDHLISIKGKYYELVKNQLELGN